MPVETITRAEFDKRLDAANLRRAQELQQVEKLQADAEQLLSHYEHTLSEIEAQLENSAEELPLRSLLRKRLNELAEKTASVAASL